MLAEIFPPDARPGQRYSRRFALQDPRQRSVGIDVLRGRALAPIAECRVVRRFDVPLAPRRGLEESVEIAFVLITPDRVRISVTDLAGGASQEFVLNLDEAQPGATPTQRERATP